MIATMTVSWILWGLASSSDVVSIELRDHATVEEAVLRLDHIAELEGGDEATLKRLGRLDLGEAPAPGGTRRITRAGLRSWLVRIGHDPDSFRVGGAARTQVSRASRTLSSKAILQAAIDFLEDRDASDADRLEIEATSRLPQVVLPASGGPPEIGVEYAGQATSGRAESLRFIIDVDDTTVQRFDASFAIRRYAKVLVADSALERGSLLDSAPLRLEEVDLSRARGELVRSRERVLGRVLRRRLRPGAVLTLKDTFMEPIIHRGDRVTLRFQMGRLIVTAHGTATSDAAIGESINVRNLSTKMVVRGKVTGPGVVDV